MLVENGGFDVNWVASRARPALWDKIRRDSDGDYACQEFVNSADNRLLYVEVWC